MIAPDTFDGRTLSDICTRKFNIGLLIHIEAPTSTQVYTIVSQVMDVTHMINNGLSYALSIENHT